MDIANTDGATQLAQPRRRSPTFTAAVNTVLNERADIERRKLNLILYNLREAENPT